MNRYVLLMLPLFAGCASQPPAISQSAVATLTFAPAASQEEDGISPAILRIDDKWLEDRPTLVYVRPGRRAVGINCPGRIVLDTPPPVTATFVAGSTYEIHCYAGKPAVIRLAGE